MSSTLAGIIFLATLILALVAVHVPLGDYMYRVYNPDEQAEKHSRFEKVVYKAIGANPESEQGWGAYARSVLEARVLLGLPIWVVAPIHVVAQRHVHRHERQDQRCEKDDSHQSRRH